MGVFWFILVSITRNIRIIFYTYVPRLLEYNLVFESHKSIILSTQQLIAGGNRDGTESHNVYQSDVLEQYQ